MPEVINETFAGTNGNALAGDWSKSATWATGTAVHANNGFVRGSVAGAVLYLHATPADATSRATAVYKAVGSGGFSVGHAVCVSATGDACYLVIYAVSSQQVQLYRQSGGALGTAVGTYAMPVAAGRSYTIELDATSQPVRVRVDGVERISYTDGSPLAGTLVGLWINGNVTDSTGMHVDSLTADTDAGVTIVDVPALVADGDSITAGAGVASVSRWPTVVAINTPATLLGNFGVSGQRVDEMIADADTQVDVMFDDAPGAARRVCAMLGGINDANQAASAATIQTRVQTYHEDRRAAGWLTMGFTVFPAATVTGSEDDARQEFNAWMRANHGDFCDYFVDLDADPRLQDTGDATYFQEDEVHPTATGLAVIAAHVEAALADVALVSAVTAADGLTTVLTFDFANGPLLPASGVTGFTLKVNGNNRSVTIARTDVQQVTLTHSAVYVGATIKVGYASGNVTDSASNALPPFADFAVTNGSEEEEPEAPVTTRKKRRPIVISRATAKKLFRRLNRR